MSRLTFLISGQKTPVMGGTSQQASPCLRRAGFGAGRRACPRAATGPGARKARVGLAHSLTRPGPASHPLLFNFSF